MTKTGAERVKDYRDRHRAKGLCTNCPRKVLPGYTLCALHREKDTEKCRVYYWKNREKQKARLRERRKRMKKEGRCTSCLAPLGEQDQGHVKCVNCRHEMYRPRGQPYYGGIDNEDTE